MAERSSSVPSSTTVGLLTSLPEALREQLAAVATTRRFADGQFIHRAGDVEATLSIIRSGRVHFSRTDSDGITVGATMLGPGESFGELPFFTGRPRTHDAIAHGPVVLDRVSRPRFKALLDRQPRLRDELLRNLADMLARSLDMLDDERRLPIGVRVAKLIDSLAPTAAKDAYSVRVTQAELAEMLGVTRVSVGTAARVLRDEGLVELSYGSVKVSGRLALARWIERHSVSTRGRRVE